MEGQTEKGAQRELAERFRRRLIEHARQGIFGSMRTLKASYQSALATLISFIDNPGVPVMLHGEAGSGKRRIIEDFVTIQNFYVRLAGVEPGSLRVFRGDFVREGFTLQFQAPFTKVGDILYVEHVDRLDEACQKELINFLKLRKSLTEAGHTQPRIFIGTERALSILVLCGEFSRELFALLSGFAVFVPALRERSEDIPQLIQSAVQEMTGRVQTPPAWLVDGFSRRAWAANIDEMRQTLRNALALKPELARWSESDVLPPSPRHFVRFDAEACAAKTLERGELSRAMASAQGDIASAARALGVSKAELMRKLLEHGLRSELRRPELAP